MLKHIILAAALVLPAGAAFAENGCDGYCRGGERNHYRDRAYHRWHDRYYGRHHHRPRTVVSVNYGWAPRVYSYPYYYPQQVVYAPAPVAPQPQVVYMNDMNSREVDLQDGRYCREYQSVSRIGGAPKQTYGTACMQPDGSWEIVS